jgi:hypothetical protein
MGSVVEGFFRPLGELLHRASRGPPPREIAGRIERAYAPSFIILSTWPVVTEW